MTTTSSPPYVRPFGPLTALLLTAALVCSRLTAPSAWAASATIASERVGTDSTGAPLQAHGGGMLKLGSTCHWVGEDKLDVPG